jgi:acyl-CoA thioesterase I
VHTVKQAKGTKRVLKATVIAIIIIALLVGLLVLRAFVVIKGQISTYRVYWNQRAEVNQDHPNIRYIALGDSAAQAVGASTPSKGYVGLIANKIEASFNSVQVINISKSGSKTADALREQIPRLQALKPTSKDIITLEIGANDVVDFDPTNFEQNMSNILDAVPPNTIVADVPYFGGGARSNKNSNAVQASKIIRRLATERNLRLVKLEEITTKNDSLRNYAADFFHPSDRNYNFWFQAFEPVIAKDIERIKN